MFAGLTYNNNKRRFLMTRSTPNPWLFIPKPQPTATLRLICFPYAGGSAQIFYPWINLLPDWVELVAVQLPGRSTRMSEPALMDTAAIMQALLPQISPILNQPYVLFGHSLGATLAFEMMRYCRLHHLRQPALFMPAGRRAPHITDLSPPTWQLPDAQFIEKLRVLNGTPQSVLEHEELMQLVLPVLQADLAVAEQHQYQPQSKLTVPFYVLGGEQDEANHTEQAMQAWQQHTSADFKSALLSGDHFFIHSQEKQLLDLVNAALLHVVARE